MSVATPISLQTKSKENNDSLKSSSSHAHGHHASSTGKALPRIVGSAIAGAAELCLFHPLDTVAKRLMTTTTKYIVPGQTMHNLNQVIFKSAADKGIVGKFGSLFPGVGYAMGYKVLQRVYKFGGQPMVADALNQHAGQHFKKTFGDKNGKSMMQATAGSIVGVGEIILLPLDVLKIKSQTNPDALKNVGILKMFLSNPAEFWKGAGFTAARNAPGSFALFGANAYMKRSVFHLQDGEQATLMQHLIGSTAGACASIIVAQPFDVVKTRIQKSEFGSTVSGVSVIKTLIKEEGISALFKGLTPKVLVVSPKLIFSFTVAQSLIEYFEHKL